MNMTDFLNRIRERIEERHGNDNVAETSDEDPRPTSSYKEWRDEKCNCETSDDGPDVLVVTGDGIKRVR